MQLVKKIISYIALFVSLFLSFTKASAQENSPYSRYGIGDLYPTQTIAARGLAGMSAAYSDGNTLNADNPASYSGIPSYKGINGGYFAFDIGVSIDSRTLHNASPVSKYNSVNFIPSYIIVGFPINKKHFGLAAGLKPISRINYSIESFGRGPDSLHTLYNGSGGLNEAFVGLGKRWGSFSLGVNGGYLFGRKEISTDVLVINDSVGYHNGRVTNKSNFGSLFANAGFQWNIKLKETKDSANKQFINVYGLTIGAAGTLKQNVNVTSNVLNETYYYNADGAVLPYDTIKYQTNPKDKVVLPTTFNAGVMFTKNLKVGERIFNKWMIGAELSAGNWGSQYRYNGLKDQVTNNWMLRFGGAIIPSLTSTGLFSRSTYRLGLYTGKDYIDADGNGLKTTAVTLGMGIPLKTQRYSNQSTLINLAAEIGKRGTNVNNVTENFFKLSLGLSLTDLWFQKRKYD